MASWGYLSQVLMAKIYALAYKGTTFALQFRLISFSLCIPEVLAVRREREREREERRGENQKMSLVSEEVKAQAESYRGDEMCQEKSKFLLKEMGLPNGLLPLKDMEECGYVKETGFVWLKQKKKTDHKFEKIGKLVSYAPNITAHIEHGKIKKLTGVKTKELLVWVTLSDIYVDDPPTGKITFKTPAGLFRTFPVSAFEIEEGPKDANQNKEVKEGSAALEIKEV